MYPNHRIRRPSIYNRPSFHEDDYSAGEVIYVTNPATGRVEPRRTIERRWYPVGQSANNGDSP